MRSTAERRQPILEYISDRRFVKMQEIADEFGICLRTAKSDVQLLSCSYPIVTENWRGGGIRVMDGWYLSRRYLHDDQEALLRELMPGLQPDKQEVLQQILTAFAKPRKGDINGITQDIREGAVSV